MNSEQLYKIIEDLQARVLQLEAEKADLLKLHNSKSPEEAKFEYKLIPSKNLSSYLLETRERYLATLVEIQRRLLSFHLEAIFYPEILQLLGECSRASRVYVFENQQDQQVNILTVEKAQWFASEIIPDLNFPKRSSFTDENVFAQWLKKLAKGEPIIVSLGESSQAESQFLESQGILAILILPLIVKGKFFGFIRFDRCVEAQQWEEEEIALLKLAAAEISVAKEQHQAEVALQKLNQELEDRVKKRTKELEKAKEQLETVLDAVPASISWISSDLCYLGVNKQLASMLKMSQESFIGRKVGELNSHDEFLYYLRQFFASTAEKSTAEFALPGLNSSKIYLLVAKKYDQGTAAVLVGIDITERRKAQKDFLKSAAMNQALLNAIPDSMFYLDKQGKILEYKATNDAELYLPSNQLLGKKVTEVLPKHFTRILWKYINKTLKTGELQKIEYQLPRRNGVIADWELRLALSGKDKVLGIVRNITERKQSELALRNSEKRFRAIFEQAAVGMVETSLDGKFLKVNQRLCDLLGYTEIELLEKNFFDIIYADNLGQNHQNMQAFLPKNFSSLSQEKRCQTKDGKALWVNLTISLIQAADGQSNYFLGIIEDIRHRKQAEEDIRKALARERELNQLKSNFISMTSHEFRTPLSTILGSTELLEYHGDRLAENKKKKYFHRIYNTVEHMTKMLEDILLIGKAESGGLEFAPHLLNLEEFVYNLVQELTSSSENYERIILEIKTDKTITNSYLLDDKLLRHIFTNLLSNALKYSTDKVNFCIDITTDNIIFEIIDRGIGIPENEIQHLFESFYRANNVGIIPGTGLGLSIVKNAVDLHGGKISLQSKLNVGTKVKINIPIG